MFEVLKSLGEHLSHVIYRSLQSNRFPVSNSTLVFFRCSLSLSLSGVSNKHFVTILMKIFTIANVLGTDIQRFVWELIKIN